MSIEESRPRSFSASRTRTPPKQLTLVASNLDPRITAVSPGYPSPLALSPSAFPVPPPSRGEEQPVRPPKSVKRPVNMSPTTETEARIREWLHRQPIVNAATHSSSSSMKTVQKAKSRPSTSRSNSTAPRKHDRRVSSGSSSGSTVYEDAVEEQNEITVPTLGTPFASPEVPTSSRFEDTSASVTPNRSYLTQSASADSTGERLFHEQRYRSSSSLDTPPSSVDDHAVPPSISITPLEKRLSTAETPGTVKAASAPTSPEGESKRVPLSFGGRSRLKRNSLPVGSVNCTPEDRRTRPHSLTPMSEEVGTEGEAKTDAALTFSWAPRALILSPRRSVTGTPETPASERAASITTRRTSSRLSSPGQPPSPALQPVDEEAVTFVEGSLSIPRMSVDVATQTEPIMALAPPAISDDHHSDEDRPDQAVLATYRVLPTPQSPRQMTFLEGRPREMKGSDPGRAPASEVEAEDRRRAASAAPETRRRNSVAARRHERRRSKSTSHLDLETLLAIATTQPLNATVGKRTSTFEARDATRVSSRLLDDFAFLSEPPPRSRSPFSGRHCLSSAAFVSMDQLPRLSPPLESPTSVEHPSASVPSLSSSSAKKRRSFFGFGTKSKTSQAAPRAVSGPVLLPGGMPAEMLQRPVIQAGPSATLPPSFTRHRTSSTTSQISGTVRNTSTMPTVDSMGLGPDRPAAPQRGSSGERRKLKRDKDHFERVVAVSSAASLSGPPLLTFDIFNPSSPLLPPALTMADRQELKGLFDAPAPCAEPIADLLGGRKSRASMKALPSPPIEREEKSKMVERKRSVQFEDERKGLGGEVPPVPRVPSDVLQREQPGGYLVLAQHTPSQPTRTDATWL